MSEEASVWVPVIDDPEFDHWTDGMLLKIGWFETGQVYAYSSREAAEEAHPKAEIVELQPAPTP